MVENKIIKGISFDRDVLEEMERQRGNAQRTRSPIVMAALRQYLKMEKGEK